MRTEDERTAAGTTMRSLHLEIFPIVELLADIKFYESVTG
jgi:hypothetical protein